MNRRASRLIRRGLFGLGLVLTSAAALAARRKVVIDQDAFGPGGSNLQAILLVLQSPDVDVLGITVESGDGWMAENVVHTLRMLELIGRPEVPVYPGTVAPLLNTAEATRRWETRHGKLVYKGAWTEQWPAGNVKRRPIHAADIVPPLEEGEPKLAPAAESAAAFLVRVVREHPGEVTVLALGPMTNLAVAAKLDEKFASRARELVFMGGSFGPHPANNEFAVEYLYTPRLEFNFRWDPEATRIVLHAPWPHLVQVPVDPTTGTLFSRELQQRVAAASTPVARYVARWAEAYPMWDELAAAVWLEPSLITRQERLAVDVDTDPGAGYGNTLSWAAGKSPGLGEPVVEVVFSVDIPRLEKLTVERFSQPDAGRTK